MEIALSKSFTAKEYHQMINKYFESTYNLTDVLSTTSCHYYKPSIFELSTAGHDTKFVQTITFVSGSLKIDNDVVSFFRELSSSDINEILRSRFPDCTIDSFSFQTKTTFSFFSQSGFKEKFRGINIQMHKNKENCLIRK